MKELQSFLNKSFKGNKIKKLEVLVFPLRYGATIPKGTLVIMASGDAQLRLKVLEKDTPHKGFSTPLIMNSEAQALGISPNYLHWYLSHEEIKEQLIKHATGSVLLRVPKSIINNIPVPIPTNATRKQSIKEVVITKKDDGFRELINSLYEDYRINVKHKRYRTAVILAGAMSEAIIYQLLLDEGVDKKILDDDRGLALGKLLRYLKLLKLDKSLNLPITDFANMQTKRNKAVHFGADRNKPATFTGEDLVSFNHIIKYFGI